MQEKIFKQNEVIFWEGSEGNCMYKIIEGTAAVILGYGTKDETKLTEVGEGRIFGEMAVLEGWARSATVVAVHDIVKVLEIRSEEISDFFENDPEQLRLIMKNLSSRLRDLTEDYTEACSTIEEMRRTRDGIGSRKEGLLSRISKFLKTYDRFFGNNNTLEAMQRFEELEQTREEQGEMRENLRFKKGQVIFRQGDAGDCMYYIGYGTVGIYTDYGTDSQILLTELKENHFFGEMGLLENMPRSATAVVMENDTILTRITEDGLELLFAEKPSFIMLALRHISSRLRQLTADYGKACLTISKMNNEEKGAKELTEEDEEMIRRYIAVAQSRNNRWMYY